MDAQGLSEEKLTMKPQKILLIGTLGSGKTTVAQLLARDTGFPYASIDTCRIRYGDGTVEGEERAWENFLALCRSPHRESWNSAAWAPMWWKSGITFSAPQIPVSVIWLVLPPDTCIARASQRQKKIPASIPMGTGRIFCATHPRWNRYLPGISYGAGNHSFMQYGRNFQGLLLLMRCTRRSGRSV